MSLAISGEAQQICRSLEVSPMELFLAIDGVALLIRRYERQHQEVEYEMAADGSILANGSVAIPNTTVAQEISRCANIDKITAQELAKWIPLAGRDQPNLFLGVELSKKSDGYLGIKVCPRDNSTDLAQYWGK